MDSQQSNDPNARTGEVREMPAAPPMQPKCGACGAQPIGISAGVTRVANDPLLVFYCTDCGAIINCAIPQIKAEPERVILNPGVRLR